MDSSTAGQRNSVALEEALEIAERYHRAGDLPNAGAIYREILAGTPDHALALHRLGVIAHQLGKFEIAAGLITKALSLRPQDAEAHHSLGLALRALGRRVEACNHFRRAIDFKPDFAEAHYNLGVAEKELELAELARPPLGAEEMAHFNDFFYAELGVDVTAVRTLRERLARACGLAVSPSDSQHYMFFAALAVAGFRPGEILEIGTDFGHTTRFLAQLFPDARVTTIDIPPDDPAYGDWHPEGDPAHAPKLSANLDWPNIVSLRSNTLWLPRLDLPDFDLIWLDGGHYYPEVAWDHFYCLDKLNPGGWLFSDDVTPPGTPHVRANPHLTQSFGVIDYINARTGGTFRFLLKREVPVGRSPEKRIAFWHRPAA